MPAQPLEQGQGRNPNLKGKLWRVAGFAVLTAKAIAGGVEAAPTPNQAANRGSDRGISAAIPGHAINTISRPDDGGKNSSAAKSKGKAPGVSPSAVANSIPPTTVEGKYASDHSQPDNGASHVVFANTRNRNNIENDSAKKAVFNATAGKDWSASSTGKTLDRPKAILKVEKPVPYDGSPDLLKGIGDAGLQFLEIFLDGGPILAACNPIPTITRLVKETSSSNSSPTLTPAPDISEQPLAGELVAKLAGRVTDTGFASENDYTFIDKFMKSQGVILAGIVGSREVQNYTIVMPVSRDLLDTWKQGNVEPLTYIQNIKTGEKYDLIPAGKIGANVVLYRMVKVAPESAIVRFQNPDGTLSLPARILKGNGSIDPVLGKAQRDRIWFSGLGVYYDGSLLPADAPDTTDYLKQHASAIASFALERYQELSQGKTFYNGKIGLNALPFRGSNGTTHLLIKEETESGQTYYLLNSSGKMSRLQTPPSDMRVRFDDTVGKFVYEKQGPSSDDPWYAIAYFDPDANSGSGAMVNIPATPTPSPTTTAARVPPTDAAPTAAPTPEILPLTLSIVKNIDVKSIPPELFGKDNVWNTVGDYLYSNAGVIGKDTILEKLPSYPGFNGTVVHVKVDSPSPKDSNQRPYINAESSQTANGQWAAEISHLVLQAPKYLKKSGWYKDPILQLISIGWHPNNDRKTYFMVGGVRLLTDDGKNYYVSLYTTKLSDGSNVDSPKRIPFKIGEKQIIRTELFYKGDKPFFRAFRFDPSTNNRELIDEMPLDESYGPIQGDITWLGAYPGRDVTGFEGISGELKIFR